MAGSNRQVSVRAVNTWYRAQVTILCRFTTPPVWKRCCCETWRNLLTTKYHNVLSLSTDPLFCLGFVKIKRDLKKARTQVGYPRERQFFCAHFANARRKTTLSKKKINVCGLTKSDLTRQLFGSERNPGTVSCSVIACKMCFHRSCDNYYIYNFQ